MKLTFYRVKTEGNMFSKDDIKAWEFEDLVGRNLDITRFDYNEEGIYLILAKDTKDDTIFILKQGNLG